MSRQKHFSPSGVTSARMLSRRDFVRAAARLGVSAAVAAPLAATLGFPMSAAQAEVALSFLVFSGGTQSVIPKAVAAEFQAENPGVDIEIFEASNAQIYPQMRAAQQANPDRPLVNFGYFNVGTTYQGELDDMWEPLDPERIPNMNNVLPSLRRENRLGASTVFGPIGIIYNTERVPEPPRSWIELFTNREWRGRVTLIDNSWPYNGVVQSILLHGGDLRQPQAGFDFIAENAEQILTIVPGSPQTINLFASEEAWLCIFTKAIHGQMLKSGLPVGFVVPEEGAVLQPLYLQIVKGTTPEQRAVAELIINELLSPERVLEYAVSEGYAPSVAGVELPPEIASEPAFQPEVAENAMQVDWIAVSEMDFEYRELWDRRVKSSL